MAQIGRGMIDGHRGLEGQTLNMMFGMLDYLARRRNSFFVFVFVFVFVFFFFFF